MKKNHKTMIFTIAVFFIFYCSAGAQVTQEWISRYNGPGNQEDIGTSIALDGSGNVYVTGQSWETERDYATIKYNSAGVQQWVQRYNGPGNNQDVATSIAVDAVGNVYVTGFSTGNGTSFDYCTIKYNTSGVQQWVQRYNGTDNNDDMAFSIVVDGSGSIYVTGGGMELGPDPDFDYVTIKYNSVGVQQWIQKYAGPGDGTDFAYQIAVDVSGNVYVTGGGSGPNWDYATIKYNSSGVQQWIALYNGQGNGEGSAYSIAVDGSGFVYVTGASVGSGTNFDYTTIKYNSSGAQQWVARYNSSSNISDIGHSLKVDGTGNVFVTGESEISETDRDYTTLKYNSSGVQQWVSKYNGPKNTIGLLWFSKLVIDNSENSYVTAYSKGSGISKGYATIKYNSSGIQQWIQTYYGPADSAGIMSIALDNSGNVYITGTSLGIGTDDDYSTIKYSQQIGIKIISSEIPKSFSLQQNYPNPFNPSTQIEFSIPKNNYQVKLIVYDVMGRELLKLVDEKLNTGTYKVDFNGTNLSTGIYFYKLETEGFTETKRMILLK
jgi:hypothetical protein